MLTQFYDDSDDDAIDFVISVIDPDIGDCSLLNSLDIVSKGFNFSCVSLSCIIKKYLIKERIWSIAPYGREMWTLTQRDKE